MFLAVITLQLLSKIVSKAWMWEHTRTFYMITYNLGYLVGPLLFLFFRSYRSTNLWQKWDWVHFVPFMCRTVLTIADEEIGIVLNLPLSLFTPWPTLQVISMAGYGVAIWKMVGPSNGFARQLVVAVLVIEVIIMLSIAFLIRHVSLGPDMRWTFVLLTGLMYWLTYRMSTSPDLFLASQPVPVLQLRTPPRTKYAHSGLRPEIFQGILSKLKHSLENDRDYRDPDFSIDGLAEKLGVSKHHLSQVVNQHFGIPFTELVYQHRLDEAHRRLADPAFSAEKITALAYDLGFSSLSVFATKFKKRFHVTPSEFRANAQGQSRTANST